METPPATKTPSAKTPQSSKHPFQHHAQPPMNLVGPQLFDRLEDTVARLEWSASATKIANSRANLNQTKTGVPIVRLFVERTTPRDTRKKPMEDGNEKNEEDLGENTD
ncbi:hypothetical protein HAX54_008044 [Datura stramonium]|uniref:Uncharacterized protein n=1 Tax=Datura stramonium TaxID=4076 RepID=A0ABS8WZQ1_DATST|nr:hypothetical protein [Datura stramonium]